MLRKVGQPRAKELYDTGLFMHESELQAIAAVSAGSDDRETGGDMYGWWTHGGRAVVQLVTGPGPDAVHQATHFAQDIKYFRATTKFLHRAFGLQFIGPWHSHYELGIDRPSGGDAEQIRSISTRNNFPRLVEIITTHQRAEQREQHSSPCSLRRGVAPTTRWWTRRARRVGASSEEGIHVRINSFVHTDPQSGQCQRCRIHVLPGVSPIRLVLINLGLLNGTDVGIRDVRFPMDRIIHDRAEPSDGAEDHENEQTALPDLLAEQCRRLPETVLEGMTVTLDDGLVVFELPTASEARVLVACDGEAPHVIRGVCFKATDDGELRDATAHVLAGGACPDIAQAYATTTSYVHGLNRPSITPSIRTFVGAGTRVRRKLKRTRTSSEFEKHPVSRNKER